MRIFQGMAVAELPTYAWCGVPCHLRGECLSWRRGLKVLWKDLQTLCLQDMVCVAVF
jgi:hypothetical protein